MGFGMEFYIFLFQLSLELKFNVKNVNRKQNAVIHKYKIVENVQLLVKLFIFKEFSKILFLIKNQIFDALDRSLDYFT